MRGIIGAKFGPVSFGTDSPSAIFLRHLTALMSLGLRVNAVVENCQKQLFLENSGFQSENIYQGYVSYIPLKLYQMWHFPVHNQGYRIRFGALSAFW